MLILSSSFTLCKGQVFLNSTLDLVNHLEGEWYFAENSNELTFKYEFQKIDTNEMVLNIYENDTLVYETTTIVEDTVQGFILIMPEVPLSFV